MFPLSVFAKQSLRLLEPMYHDTRQEIDVLWQYTKRHAPSLFCWYTIKTTLAAAMRRRHGRTSSVKIILNIKGFYKSVLGEMDFNLQLSSRI